MFEGNAVCISSQKKTSLRSLVLNVMLKFSGRWDGCIVHSELEMM